MSRKTCMIFLCIACTVLAASSCLRNRDIIPEDVMSSIYYDMYMTDEAVKADLKYRRMIDTLMIYEPVFNRYGYTSEDYTRSVNYYLERPDRFLEVFEKTKHMLEMRGAELKKIIEAEENRPRNWPLIDSLEILTADGVHSPLMYKCLRMLFFKPDTLLQSSPLPDSSAMLRPRYPFMIFSDSALNSDSRFEFYSSLGFMLELKEAADTTAADSTASGAPAAPDSDSRIFPETDADPEMTEAGPVSAIKTDRPLKLNRKTSVQDTAKKLRPLKVKKIQ